MRLSGLIYKERVQKLYEDGRRWALEIVDPSFRQFRIVRDNILDNYSPVRISVDGEFFHRFGGVVGDLNPIHTSVEHAKMSGFEDRPVYGTWLAGQVERLTRQFIMPLTNGKGLCYTGHEIEFRAPVYLGETIEFALKEVSIQYGSGRPVGINLELEAGKDVKKVDEKTGAEVMEHVRVMKIPRVSLAASPLELTRDKLVGFVCENHRPNKGNKIEQVDSDVYHNCVDVAGDFRGNLVVPYMHPAAFPVSLLLDLSAKQKGMPSGTFSTVETDFYDEPSLGNVHSVVRLMSRPRKRGRHYWHDFEGLCFQDGRPILRTQVRCIADVEFPMGG